MKKKQRLFLLLILLGIAGVYLADVFYFSKQPIRYPNFGITIPAGYQTHGIDVSRYQKKVDWKLVSDMRDQGQRISFAIVKATEGTHMIDSRFDDNWEKIKEVGLLRGAYLYFHTNRKGEEQAAYFIEQVRLEPGDLPPVIDIEEAHGRSKAQIQEELKACLDALEKEYGVKPMIYSNVQFYNKYIGDVFNEYPFWAAHYERCNAPGCERPWTLWQHHCNGHVNGIDAEVDFNVVNGGMNELKQLCL